MGEKRLKDTYHFHKDCKFYPECKEQLVTRGSAELIEFTCPMLKHPQIYYKGDVHSIKWQCSAFEPAQLSLDDLMEDDE